MTVDVVLATYNGERYLGDFLQSLESQSYADWRLIARDDGSNDATVAQLNAFAARFRGKVQVITRPEGAPRGAIENFSAAALGSHAPYLCFADQDDVWLPGKIARLVDQMRQCEHLYGRQTPILVHSDLQVVDCSLAPIAPSFVKYQGLDPLNGISLNRLLVRNVVTGCAMMLNSSLRDAALPLPGSALMHDWWLALVSAVKGKICFIPDPLVQYRQHGSNTLGAKRVGVPLVVNRLRFFSETRQRLRTKAEQGRHLLMRYGNELSEKDRRVLEAFVGLFERNMLSRRWCLVRFGFWDTGFIRNLGLLVAV